jgi:integrase
MSKAQRYMVVAAHLSPSMHFEIAAVAFVKALDLNPDVRKAAPLARHAGFVGRRTLNDYRDCFKALAKHFKGKILGDIVPSDLLEYQQRRSAGQYTSEKGAANSVNGVAPCANTINKECGVLIRLLRAAKAWTVEMVEGYTPLTPQEPDTQRALTPQEQEHFLRVAASKERWLAIYWYSVLALSTTMGTNELRELRLRDIDLSNAVIKVSPAGAKNRYRIRSIPLEPEALKAAEFLIARAKEIGSHLPEHVLFPTKRGPSNRSKEYDLLIPSECWHRSLFEEVRDAAGVPWFRPYDLRHTAITRLAEAGTPIQVIMEMAGHFSQKMQQNYTHISMQVKRQAANMSVLAQASALKKKPKGLRDAGCDIAQRTDAAIGAGMVSVANLIKKLTRAGLTSDVILGILSDDEVA